MRVKKLEDIHLVASRHSERKSASLPVDVRRSKTSLLKFPNYYASSTQGRTIRKVMGGEGGGEVPKRYSRKGKLNEKTSCTLIDSKKYSCYGLQKIHTRNLITKKNSCGSKIAPPPPPHNLSNGPSLM